MSEKGQERGGGSRDSPAGGVVRRRDIEPYTALRWVGTLFKAAAVFLVVAIVAEFVAGIGMEGWAALPILLGEVARTAVLAVVLWGAGDLVRLLIHLGQDIRAERILLTRIAHRTEPSREAAAMRAAGAAPEPGAGGAEERPREEREEPPRRVA